jgi:hypothetical protein
MQAQDFNEGKCGVAFRMEPAYRAYSELIIRNSLQDHDSLGYI